jgi:predicted AlkP superfamily pyrophosphatase or phosphodiesterase
MAMRVLSFLFALAAALLSASFAQAAPVLMISIDGLRPGDVLDAQPDLLKVPNLKAIVADGAYATGVTNVLPTVTYPNHTTLITGVAPAIHGIGNNTLFDPLQTNMPNPKWYWYTRDIKVKTLWDAVHAGGGVVASISWPVSVGAASIDYDLPEYWQTLTPSDLPLLRDASTPGLVDALEQASGVKLADTFSEEPPGDVARAKFAVALIALKHPQFMTLHLVSLDATQHKYGPSSMQAFTTLETIDGAVGTLVEAARKAEPDLIVVIVSDHGFAPISEDTNLMIPFIEAGFVKLDPATGKIASWTAEPWMAGGSAAIVLARPKDKALNAKVGAFLKKLVADPKSGLARMIDAKGIAALGGAPQASFWVDLKLGMETGHNLTGAKITPSVQQGTHGYFPFHPEMHATFFIDGPGLAKKGSLGEIDMRDIAPTLAGIMGVKLPSATGKPLF